MIGFLNTSYTVNENDGVANIQIGVIRGSLERPINVQFSLNAISAAGKLHDTSLTMHNDDIVCSLLVQLHQIIHQILFLKLWFSLTPQEFKLY